MEVVFNTKEQILLFRTTENGPQKRKYVSPGSSDEPLSKKLKFDNTRSVIVMRVHFEDENPPAALQLEVDEANGISPTDFLNVIYSSEDDTESFSESNSDIDMSGLNSYCSDSEMEEDFELSTSCRSLSPQFCSPMPFSAHESLSNSVSSSEFLFHFAFSYVRYIE